MFKKTLLIDLDGVLNTYSGQYNRNYIPPLRSGALEFLKSLSVEFRVLIFTSREIELATKWVFENNLSDYVEKVTNVKEPSYLIIDDRCLTFNGDYETMKKNIKSFQPWYKNN